MIIEIYIFLREQLISMFIMDCPGGKINTAAVSAKRIMYCMPRLNIDKPHCQFISFIFVFRFRLTATPKKLTLDE